MASAERTGDLTRSGRHNQHRWTCHVPSARAVDVLGRRLAMKHVQAHARAFSRRLTSVVALLELLHA